MSIDDAEAPRPALPERLAHVAGIDLTVALRNVGGDVPGLERVLNAFVRRYRLGEPALCDADAPDALNRWRSACHGLRGACATLGAASLPKGFAAFELALTPQADVTSLAPAARALHEELLAATAALAAALEPPATS